MASDHCFESCIHFVIKTDVQPGVYGTVSLTKPIDKVDSNGVPSYFSCHCNVHVKHLHRKPAKTTTTIMSVRTTFFLGICSSGWSLEDSSWLGISWNHIFRARDDGKRHDVVDEQ